MTVNLGLHQPAPRIACSRSLQATESAVPAPAEGLTCECSAVDICVGGFMGLHGLSVSVENVKMMKPYETHGISLHI